MKTQQNVKKAPSKHRYSSYALVFIVSIMLLGGVIAISSAEVDQICATNNSLLYRNETFWGCLDYPEPIAENDTLQSVTNRGSTTTNDILLTGSLDIGTTPSFAYDRKMRIFDDGVQYASRVTLIGTGDDGYPAHEFSTDGSANKRTIIRHEGEGGNDYGLAFYTTSGGSVGESMRLTGDGDLNLPLGSLTLSNGDLDVVSGRLDVGGQFESTSESFPVGSFIRTTTLTSGNFDDVSGLASGYSLRTKTNGNMGDGFGGGILLSAQDSTSSSNYATGVMARIYARRDGGDNNGALQLFTKGTNADGPTMTLRNSGYVGINETNPQYPFVVMGSNNGVTAYFEHNISVEDVIYHSDVNTQENVLETFTNDYLNENGIINHSKDEYSYVIFEREVTDYERPVTITQINRTEVKKTRIVEKEFEGIVYYHEEPYIDYIEEEFNITIYPYKKIVREEGWSASKRDAKYEKTFAEINKALSLNDTTADFTTILTEELFTKSKVPQPNVNYMETFKIDELDDKATHYAVEIKNNQQVLNMEERIVQLEGAIAQLSVELCAESNNKYTWCNK